MPAAQGFRVIQAKILLMFEVEVPCTHVGGEQCLQ